MTSAERKEIQRERMRNYFINAAKELIMEEGLKNVTTKKIGNRAGYSYATIYNYFENFNELICICIEQFTVEMAQSIRKEAEKLESNLEKLEKLTILALRYSLENVNIYSVFSTDAIDFSYLEKEESGKYIHPVYTLLTEVIQEIDAFSHLSHEDMIHLSNMIFFLFHSKLHFYIVMHAPKNEELLKSEIIDNLKFLVNTIIKK